MVCVPTGYEKESGPRMLGLNSTRTLVDESRFLIPFLYPFLYWVDVNGQLLTK